MDRLSPEQRRRCMRANKGTGTSIELMLGRALWHAGLHYRKYPKNVPGKPDFCFKEARIAVFCDGEFWHGYQWETRKHRIHSRTDYWIPKIERNQQRDMEVNDLLRRQGWTVIRFWESDIRNHLSDCVAMVQAAFNATQLCRK